MSGYDIEHGVNLTQTPKRPTRRPDLSTYYSTVNEAYGDEETINNPHSAPTPESVTAAFRLLADAYEIMLNEHGGDNNELRDMIAELEARAGQPPKERQGVPDSFLVDLDRVAKNEYPLVVRLPCDDRHLFDLECIRPWLKLNPTCPLDRKVLVKKRDPPSKDDAEEEDYDDYYA
ncbi:hypothetical protein FKW77_006331 [Venturia effusa]|uniref:RING-type domain-containing protein n=1 Tax=Venturia effusa TaxID=50376 RepID=A0A517L9G1_9PEZI|nr:hypothetical protein FKW77_006331 [Venturia effusa]